MLLFNAKAESGPKSAKTQGQNAPGAVANTGAKRSSIVASNGKGLNHAGAPMGRLRKPGRTRG